MNYLKNAILRTLELLNAVSFIIFACMVDSESPIPVVICICNFAWLVLFFYVNEDYYNKRF